jgi:hypothetical protein
MPNSFKTSAVLLGALGLCAVKKESGGGHNTFQSKHEARKFRKDIRRVQKMISPFTSSRQVAVATRLGYFGGGRGALRSEKFHKFSDLFEALRITAI